MDTMIPLSHGLPVASNFYVSVITQRFMVAHDLRSMTMQFFLNETNQFSISLILVLRSADRRTH